MSSYSREVEYPMNLLSDLGIVAPAGEMDAVRERVENCFAYLSERDGEAVRLYYIEGLSLTEIGERFGRSKQAVWVCVQRALKTLGAARFRDYILDGLDIVREYKERNEKLEEVIHKLRRENLMLKEKLYKRGVALDMEPVGLDTDIRYLELPVRALQALEKQGFRTVGDFVGKSESEIRGIRNIGEKAYFEIAGKLRGYNILLV